MTSAAVHDLVARVAEGMRRSARWAGQDERVDGAEVRAAVELRAQHDERLRVALADVGGARRAVLEGLSGRGWVEDTDGRWARGTSQ